MFSMTKSKVSQGRFVKINFKSITMKLISFFITRPASLLFILFFAIIGSIKAQTYCSFSSQVAYDFGLTTPSTDTPYGIIEQPNGKLLIYGTSYFSSANSFRVSMMRLNADLTIDSTGFGQNGKVVKTWSQRNYCITAELQSNGKILVGGTQAPGNGSSTVRPYVGRFDSDGSVDSTFGIFGSVLINSFGKGSVIGIKELPNGKIRLVLGRDNPQQGFVVMQLNSDGTNDLSFGASGAIFHAVPTALWNTEKDEVLFMADTSAVIIAASYSGGVSKPLIMKIAADGSVDSTFAQNGVLDINTVIPISFSWGTRGALTPGEDIIIGSSTGSGAATKMFLYKINGQTGVIDSTGFGTNGKVVSLQGSSFTAVRNLTVNPSNGDIYTVGGFYSSGNRAATWRVNSSGVEVNQCGGNPIKQFPMGYNYTSNFYDALFLCNGALRLVGNSGVLDTAVSYGNQQLNYMIPYDTMPNPITYVSDTACDSYTSPSGNFVWDSTGTFMDTMTNVLGCDSLLSIDLVIKNSTTATINPIACDNYVSPSGLYSWATSGSYMDTIPNTVGCDSIITINLTVNYSSWSSIMLTVCNSYTSPSGNYTWATSGTYMDTIPNTTGCDSVITFVLTVNYSTSATISATACSSYSSPSANYVWTNSGTYLDTIPNAMGCDSVITVNLTINTPTAAAFSVTACDHYVSPNGIDVWLSSGTYMTTIQNTTGCDSVITINLTINNVDTSVTVNGFILTASTAGAEYQWLDCANNYSEINGETGQTYLPNANGNYAVEITQNGCADTSACYTIAGVGIDEQNVFSEFNFYPNPTNGALNFDFQNLKDVGIKIFDLNGRLVHYESGINKKTYQLFFEASSGMYVLEISSAGVSKTFKLVVQ